MSIERWRAENPLVLLRKARKISQQDFALVVGVSPVMIRSWEKGAYRPTEDRLDQMARALKYPALVEAWNKWEAQRPTAL